MFKYLLLLISCTGIILGLLNITCIITIHLLNFDIEMFYGKFSNDDKT